MQKILIVDDHPLYREGMVSALRQRLPDIEVLSAHSAEDGLRALDSAPDTDLVLIDIRLPGMDGFAALGLYSSRYPTVARMLVSGQDEPELVRRAFSSGASGFIHKSMAVEQVVRAIETVLEGGVFLPHDSERPALRRADRSQGDSDAGITLRQLEVLRLLGEGCTNKEIANTLGITERTAKAHVAALFEALRADNRTQAVVAAQRLGYLTAAPGRA